SLRPGNTHTVPLRPGGGAQRANRSTAPSGVLTVPTTTPSGTGLAGMETSCTSSRTGVAGMETSCMESSLTEAGLYAPGGGTHVTSETKYPCTGNKPTPCFACAGPWAAWDEGQAIVADRPHVAPRRICHAYIRSSPPLSFHRRIRSAVLDARSGCRL